MRTLIISMILTSMISCFKEAFLKKDSSPTVAVGDDQIGAIIKDLARRDKPDLAIIKDMIAGKSPGWKEPIEYTVDNSSNSMTLLQIMSYYQYPYEEIKPLIEAWIKHGGDPQAKDAHGSVALHLAVRTINTPIVQLLLDLKVKDTITDSAGKLAIHHACQRCEKRNDEGNNMCDVIASLLKPLQSRLVGWTESSRTESQAGTEHASNDPVKRDIKRDKERLLNYTNSLDGERNSPLYYASKSMLRCLKALNKPDADIQKYKTRYEQAQQCYLSLKQAGANANQQEVKDNKSEILMWGCKLEKKLGENLVSDQVNKPENYIEHFIEKVENKEEAEIARLIEVMRVGIPINEEGPTILYWLINNGHQEVAYKLLEKAEEEAVGKSLLGDQSSCCPLYRAVEQGDLELAKQLIYGKAIQKYEGKSTAQVAADKVEAEVVEKRGRVITRTYVDNGKTLLDAACESRNLKTVQLILESMAICAELREEEKARQGSPLSALEIMDELNYLPSDTHGYEKAIRKFIEAVRKSIQKTHKELDKKARSTTGRSGGGNVSVAGNGGGFQYGTSTTAPSWYTSREHAVSEARQAWRDKRNRIWEQKLWL